MFYKTISQYLIIQMGNKVPEVFRRNQLKVATLNYCGIAYSPFEFYFSTKEKQLKEISGIFRRLIPRYVYNFDEKAFRWQMGKIEKNFKKGRYSHMFDPEVGIFWKRFISRADFEKKWDLEFSYHVRDFKFKWTLEEKDTVRLYDFIMYHTLLVWVHGVESFEEAIQKDTGKFVKKIKELYNMSFLNEQKKLGKFLKGLEELNPDVFFIQEYSTVLFDALTKPSSRYHVTVDQRKDSLVLLNRSSFTQIRQFAEITEEVVRGQRQSLKWAESIAVISADNYIFACLHLSSQEAKNEEQVSNLKKDLVRLRQALPQYELVVGGDINSFIQPDPRFTPIFSHFPYKEYDITTLKKRTYSQAQFHKAEEEVRKSKDRIFSTLNIERGVIRFIGAGQANDKCYLPTDEHPHDHFLVVAHISF